jgi:hypothetical protein
VKSADGNVFFHELDSADYTGTFTGSHVFDGTIEEFKDGSVILHGIATVTGCGTGTVVFDVTGKIDPSGLVTSSPSRRCRIKARFPFTRASRRSAFPGRR